MVRAGTVDDIPALLVLGRAMHAESRFRTVRYVPERVEATLRAVLGGAGCIFVAERAGEIVGGFVGLLVPYYFSDEKCASDLAIFVRPDRRGGILAASLIHAYIDWAREQGVRHVEIGVSTGVHPEKTGALLERLGLKPQGGLYVMEL